MLIRFYVLVIFSLAAVAADPEIKAKLRPVLDQAITNRDVPGLAVAVLRDGKLVYNEALGVADSTTLFYLASVTKTFTATAIMQLVEQGKVDLDQHPRKYVPYFDPKDPKAEGITIRQMLSHTAGLQKDPEWLKAEFDEGALERYVRRVSGFPLEAAPGERFIYSNQGYNILGDVIARVSGETYEGYVKRHILEPLGMGCELTMEGAQRRAYARPYVMDGAYQVIPSPVFPYDRKRAPSSAMQCSLNDMIRWAMVHLNRGELDGKRILKASTYDLMWKPPVEKYQHMALGWFLWRREGEMVIGHNGSDMGFVAEMQLIPEKGIAMVVLCNLDHGPYRPIVTGALDAALGKATRATIKPLLAKVLYETISSSGVDAAAERFRTIRRDQPDLYEIHEGVLNELGYKLMERGKLAEAVVLLRLNVETYPASANVYDSLGEACNRAGDKACALENYRKALEKNPKNRKAAEAVKALAPSN